MNTFYVMPVKPAPACFKPGTGIQRHPSGFRLAPE